MNILPFPEAQRPALMVQPGTASPPMATFKTLKATTSRDRARRLRREDTHAEARLWNVLRAHRLGGWKWKRQVPEGAYILDFICIEAGLVVEVDGGQHSERVAYDARRTAYLERRGLRVIRFWNNQVLTNRDGVCLMILAACGGERQLLSPEAQPEGRGRERGDADGAAGTMVQPRPARRGAADLR